MGDMIKQVWLVIVLALLFGTALAFVDRSTSACIAENRQQQVRELSQLATTGELTYDHQGRPEFTVNLEQIEDPSFVEHELEVFRVVDSDHSNTVQGYAIVAAGVGWERLKILVGLSADLSQITGLEIVESRETPGLGERISTDDFREQFEKSTAEPLTLVKGNTNADNQIQALTGATISSAAVTGMVNTAVQQVKIVVGKDATSK